MIQHGWVTPLPGGERSRCGGPELCDTCKMEQAARDLYDKWASDEAAYRRQVAGAIAAGSPFAAGSPCAALAAHAVQLAECRQQLRRAFGWEEPK